MKKLVGAALFAISTIGLAASGAIANDFNRFGNQFHNIHAFGPKEHCTVYTVEVTSESKLIITGVNLTFRNWPPTVKIKGIEVPLESWDDAEIVGDLSGIELADVPKSYLLEIFRSRFDRTCPSHLVSVVPQAVVTETIFAIANFNTSDETLITIDRNSGMGTAVGPLDSTMAPFGLADRNGQLFTFDQFAGRIRQLDPATGATLEIIDIGVEPNGEGSLTFRANGTGYLASSQLYSFDITAPSSTSIGPLGNTFDGLDFRDNDVLYGLSKSSPTDSYKLYTVDPATAAATLVGDTGLPGDNALAGLTFAPDGPLLAVIADSLYSLNVDTGAPTLIGPTGFSGISGLSTLAAP